MALPSIDKFKREGITMPSLSDFRVSEKKFNESKQRMSDELAIMNLINDDAHDYIKASFESSWDYDDADPEDLARKDLGSMPVGVESKYTNSGLDQWLKSSGLPSYKNLEKYLEDYNEHATKSYASSNAKQDIRNKWADIYNEKGALSEEDAAAAYWEIAGSDDYKDYLDNFKTEHHVFDPDKYDSDLERMEAEAKFKSKDTAYDLFFRDEFNDFNSVVNAAKEEKEREENQHKVVVDARANIVNTVYGNYFKEAVGDANDLSSALIGASAAFKNKGLTPSQNAELRLREQGLTDDEIEEAFIAAGKDIDFGLASERMVEAQRKERESAENEAVKGILADLTANADAEAVKTVRRIMNAPEGLIPIVEFDNSLEGFERLQAAYADEMPKVNRAENTLREQGYTDEQITAAFMAAGFKRDVENTAAGQNAAAAIAQAFIDNGASELDAFNAMARNNLRVNSAAHTTAAYTNALAESGMSAEDIALHMETMTDDEKRIMLGQYEFDPSIQTSKDKQILATAVSIPIRAALSIASGIVGFADLVSGEKSSEAMHIGEASRWLSNASAKMTNFGRDMNTPLLNIMGDVGSELLRMYATSAAGTALAGVSGASTVASTASSTGIKAVLKNIAKKATSVETIPFVATAMGNYFAEATAMGASRRDATLYAVVAGAGEGALEALGSSEMFGKMFSSGKMGKLIKNGKGWLNSDLGVAGKGLVLSILGEGIEEGASYGLSGIMQKATFNPEWKFNNEEFWSNVGMGMLIGGLGSAASSNGLAGVLYGKVQEQLDTTGNIDLATFDAMYSALEVEDMPQAKQRTLKGLVLDLFSFKQKNAEVAKATVNIANADTDFAERTKYLDNQVELAKENTERKLANFKAVREDTTKVVGAANDYKAAEKTEARTIESVESQKVKAEKEHAGVVNNNTQIRDAANADIDAHHVGVVNNYVAQEAAAKAEQILADVEARNAADVAEETEATPIGMSVGANLGMLNPKVSRARTNTLEAFFNNAGIVSEELAAENYQYDSSNDVRNMMEARRRIGTLGVDANIEMLADNGMWNGADLVTAMGALSSLGEEASWTGDYWEVQNWSKEIAAHVSAGGQVLQAASIFTRTPEGMIIEAQKNIKKAEDNATPKQKQEIGEQTRIADEAIDKATDEAANEAVEDIVDKIVGRNPNKGNDADTNAEKDELEQAAEMLANKVVAATMPKTPREADFVKQMVYDLLGVAKQTIKPQESIKTDPYKKVGTAYLNRDKYESVWNAAQEEIRKRIAENPDFEFNQVLESDLQRYFSTGYTQPVSDSAIVSLLRKGVRDMKMKMKDFIIAYDVNKTGTLAELSDYITEMAGIDGSAASAMSLDLHSAFRNLRKDLAINYLKHSFSDKQNRFKNVDKLLNEIEIAGVENKSAVHDAIKHENGLPVLTDADIQGIYDNMRLMNDNFAKANQLRAAGDAKAAHIAERDAKKYQELAAQIVVDKEMVSGRQKFRSVQRIMMLLNPKSNIKNTSAGVPMAAIENIKDLPAAMFDVLVSKKTGKRTTSFNIPGKIAAQAKGFAQAIGDIKYDIKEGVDTSNRGMPGRYSLEEGGAARNTNATPRIWEDKVMNALDSVVGTALRTGDRVHFDAAYYGRLAELEMLGIDPNTADSQKEAIRYALDRTFQNNSNLAQALSGVRNALNKAHIGSVGLGDLLMPFVQTPANIADKLIDYSGIGGTAKAIAQLVGAKKTGKFDQKLFVDRLGRSFTGFGIMALGMALAKSGALLAGADSQEEREMLDNAGVEEYAIKIGNTWHTLDWAEPAGSLLLMGAEMQKAGMSKEGFIQSAYAAGITGMDALFDLDVLQNVSAIFGGYGSVTENVGDALINSATQFVPSILNTVTKTIDPVARDTYDENPLVETMKKMAAKVPGLSYLLPEKISTTGEVKRRSGGLVGRALQATILPNYYAVESNDPVNSELFRLYQEGYTDQMLPQAPKSVSFKLNGENISYTLSAEERRILQQLYGEACYAKALDIIGGMNYSEYDDAKREEKLKDAISSAEQAAKKKFINQLKEQMEGGN